jgi:hypothetical protein
MKLKDWLEKWGMTSLTIKAGFLETEWRPKDPDRKAAWELYVELLTRVATQDLAPEDGDEQTALASIHNLFGLTRETLKNNAGCNEFAKIAIVVLNQRIRPFTAKWHKLSLDGAFKDKVRCHEFRSDLAHLQKDLRSYTAMLADMAAVEDLTDIEGYGKSQNKMQ